MADRWNPDVREVAVQHPQNRVFVPGDAAAPGGELSSQHRVTMHPAGFRVRERGAIDATVVHAYRCPVHGVVDVRVERANVPDLLPCPGWRIDGVACGFDATWCGSFAGQGWAAGECRS